MIKAIFADFYGTLVHEDGAVIKKVTREILDTGNAESTSDIDDYWWQEFQELFVNAYGDKFQTQRKLERDSIVKTIEHFGSTANAHKLSEMMFEHWVKPPIFEETKEFFERAKLPIYIVSNIDRADVLAAIEYHGLKPAGVFTSEDAKSYKPRKEIFEMALAKTGLKNTEVVHIGDSLSSDIKGAYKAGIKAIWINRGKREVPDRVQSVNNLLSVLDCT